MTECGMLQKPAMLLCVRRLRDRPSLSKPPKVSCSRVTHSATCKARVSVYVRPLST